MDLHVIAGARPNFMKIAPILNRMKNYSVLHPVLIHTGQHYDRRMSELFFEELNIPKPDINLEVGAGSHATQTAAIMERFEPILLKDRPDLVMVVGDVNSTIACALTAVKLGVPVAHVEAGLRSFDRGMPEEINRVLTDAISDWLFTTERSAEDNLLKEGVGKERIYFVGNVMIDTLLSHKQRADQSEILGKMGVQAGNYGLLTLHRPSNVDSKAILESILSGLNVVSREIPILFPCHPRTRRRIEEFGLQSYILDGHGGHPSQGVILCEPVGYLDFLKLMAEARLVLTDSGGIQEETTILGVRCLTLRENTERPVTVSQGTNRLVGTKREHIIQAGKQALLEGPPQKSTPDLWDGKASERILQILLQNA